MAAADLGWLFAVLGVILVGDAVRHPDREQILRLLAVLLLILAILLAWLAIAAVGAVPPIM